MFRGPQLLEGHTALGLPPGPPGVPTTVPQHPCVWGRSPPPSSRWLALLGPFPRGLFGVSAPGPEGRLPGSGAQLSLRLNWGGGVRRCPGPWGVAGCRKQQSESHTIGTLGEVAIQSPSRGRKPGRDSEAPRVTCRQLSWTGVCLGPSLAPSCLSGGPWGRSSLRTAASVALSSQGAAPVGPRPASEKTLPHPWAWGLQTQPPPLCWGPGR